MDTKTQLYARVVREVVDEDRPDKGPVQTEFVTRAFMHRVLVNTITRFVTANTQNILLAMLVPRGASESSDVDVTKFDGLEEWLPPHRHCSPELKTFLLSWYWRQSTPEMRVQIFLAIEGCGFLGDEYEEAAHARYYEDAQSHFGQKLEWFPSEYKIFKDVKT